MHKRWTRKFNRFILKNRMLLFLVSTSLLILSFPLIQNHYSHFLFIIELLFNLLLIIGINLVSRNKKIVTTSLLLAVMAIIIVWFDYILHSRPLLLFGLLTETVFACIAVITIIQHVLQYKKVTEDKIYGAMSAYLLIGIVWSLIYSIIELADPNSFFFANGFIINQQILAPHRFYFSQFLYFSFVTISTLGYGDIVPVSGPARLFSSLEAITGQLYVAVLIARLVGLHISHTHLKAQKY